jgi:tetratricopeptide (TPR) repeat protein
MATTETKYGVISLGDRLAEAEDDRGFVRVRYELDVGAFGVSAAFQKNAGELLIREHDEMNPGADGHEELYVIVQGSATFTVDGEEIEAPQGTTVFVRDPASKRGATATADNTIVLAVGGRRGEAYRLAPAAAATGFYSAYQEKDYATALAATQGALELYPGNAHLLYNVACMSALLGDRETSLTALEESVTKWEPFKEMAREDDDFTSLRNDPKFVELVA